MSQERRFYRRRNILKDGGRGTRNEGGGGGGVSELTPVRCGTRELVKRTQPNSTCFFSSTSRYRGDVCSSTGTLYTNDGPAPHGTNSSECGPPSETGPFFHATEMHGVTMQCVQWSYFDGEN